MYSLLRGRIGAGTVFFLVLALIKGGNIWLRQHNAQLREQTQYTGQPAFAYPGQSEWSWQRAPSEAAAQPTFMAPVPAMQHAQSSSPPSTPVHSLAARAYVQKMTSLLKQVNTRLHALLDLYDEISAQGEMNAQQYNQGLAKIMTEAGSLHAAANEIRSIHPPQIFESYHDETLQALAAAEGALVTLMLMADGGPGLTQAEQDAMTQTFNEAAASLNIYPRLESHTSSGQALATLRASIINSRSDASQRPRPSTPQPHNAP